MSIYNSQVKTHIIDPVYNRSNFRAEYRLEPNTIFLSNMRLIGLGAIGTGGDGSYNGLVGSLGVIKQISLYDDNQLLDQLLQAPTFLGFKKYNTPNEVNMDLNADLIKNRSGNIINGNNAGANQVGRKVSEFLRPNHNGELGQVENLTSKGYLPLKDVFPLLRNLVSMDTSVFKNLKVIVEYNEDVDEYAKETNNTPYNTIEAQLVADEIVGDVGKSKLGGFKGVSYQSIEHDRVVIPKMVIDSDYGDGSVAPLDGKQQQTLHINGFNNKTLGRMLIVKNPTLLANYKTGNNNLRQGKLMSVANNKEELQCRVNGSSILTGSGLSNINQRLGMLHDVWGKCSSYPFCNGTAYTMINATNRNTQILGGHNDIGVLDYYGLNINDKIEDLQIDFSRTAVYIYSQNPVNHPARKLVDDALSNGSVYNQAINLNIYAEVYKTITPQGGGYVVQYD